MADKLSRIGMNALRAGALALALGLGAFLVVNAQRSSTVEAQPRGAEPEAAPEDELDEEDIYLFSSKSVGPLPGGPPTVDPDIEETQRPDEPVIEHDGLAKRPETGGGLPGSGATFVAPDGGANRSERNASSSPTENPFRRGRAR